jgi:hypothetical protein
VRLAAALQSRGAAPERSPQRELWVPRAPNQQAPAGATDSTDFCRPIRGSFISQSRPDGSRRGLLSAAPPASQPRQLESRRSRNEFSASAPASRLGLRQPSAAFSRPPRRSEAKRPPTPRGRPKRQLRSAPPPHSRSAVAFTGAPVLQRRSAPIQLPASAGCGAGGKASPCGLPLPGTNLPGLPRTAFLAVSGPQSLSANFSGIPSIRKSRLGTPPWSSCA